MSAKHVVSVARERRGGCDVRKLGSFSLLPSLVSPLCVLAASVARPAVAGNPVGAGDSLAAMKRS